MPQTNSPTGGTPFPYDPVRSGIVMDYRIDDFIADEVLPMTPPLGDQFQLHRVGSRRRF